LNTVKPETFTPSGGVTHTSLLLMTLTSYQPYVRCIGHKIVWFVSPT